MSDLLDDFLVRAGLAGIGVSLAAGPLGCFVIWRRMAYFGDATAHAAILGVALALALNISVAFGALLICLLMAATVAVLDGKGLAADSLLGVLSHCALATGLVAVSFLSGVRIDLMGYLFGDILAVGHSDLAVIWGGGGLVIALLVWRWQALLTTTLSPELAHASGLDPLRERLVLTLTLAVTVAISIKVVGVLLISSLLLIPAASARAFSRTPEMMAIIAALIGTGSAVGGLWASLTFDTPAGPSIVVIAAVAFVCSALYRAYKVS